MDQATPPPEHKTLLFTELKTQWLITTPLICMNLTWFAKIAITTAFLGRLGELPLAGGTLGFTFANVTGFSILNGLCGAMEPICGQAFGAKNFKLLHKTLVMSISLLLMSSIPISILWINVDRILIQFGQQHEIASLAGDYLLYMLPDLIAISFLCPLKTYLSTQNVTVPIMIASALATVLHVPANIFLSRAMGLRGVSVAVWATDFVVVAFLGAYVLASEMKKGGKWDEGGWWDHKTGDWSRLFGLCGPCCLTTCLEWWCYEIMVLITGRLPSPAQSLGTLAIVLNFDYLVFSFMLSAATCASVRVANEVGGGRAGRARLSARVCLAVGAAAGVAGGAATATAGGWWGPLYSRDGGVVGKVRRVMPVMAAVEVVNFPLAVCGGILRGTAKPWLGTYANIFGFYVVALPVGVVLGFRVGMGLEGLLLGFVGGVTACFAVLLVFVARIDWDDEVDKARRRVEISDRDSEEGEDEIRNGKQSGEVMT
ncbi:MATE efflux family protein [Striga hermonthica]|uniref:Protein DETOXIFICATION n=1 Tax=Striga hermonthica TaxID=68872 RepID=A0A9N7RTX1_STRHE|nr:MATE efflux family protein [Striga hermonthica]